VGGVELLLVVVLLLLLVGRPQYAGDARVEP
jgi:hypothetical protein